MHPTDPSRNARQAEQAGRFGRARPARSSVGARGHVELIAELAFREGEARAVDVVRLQDVSHGTVTETVSRLQRDGVVVRRPCRGSRLTEAHELARRVRARHLVVVRLLRAIGLPGADAESDAEGIGHHVSAATLDDLGRVLGRSGGKPDPGQ